MRCCRLSARVIRRRFTRCVRLREDGSGLYRVLRRVDGRADTCRGALHNQILARRRTAPWHDSNDEVGVEVGLGSPLHALRAMERGGAV